MPRLIGLVFVLVAAAGLARAEDTTPVACSTEAGIFVAAGTVVDGRSFRLKDGREVRLAGIEVTADNATAKEALGKLISGHLVLLTPLELRADRYGRLLAHGYILQDGAQIWIERDLVGQGQALAGAYIGSAACAAALLAAERQARQARLGLWADPAYEIKAATDAKALLAGRGRFTVAAGKVLSVRESGGTIYVNFGRVWSRNLTVTILKRNERLFAAAGIDLSKLEGRRLLVRGWIEDRGGPRIEATRPEQIEIADQG